MTTPKERMSDPTQVKRMTDAQLEKMQASALRLWGELPIRDVAAEVITLRAELTAARTVEDGDVAKAIAVLEVNTDGGVDLVNVALIDLLRRLSAAKAEAERELDSARADALEEAAAVAYERGRAISKGTYRSAGPNDTGEQIAAAIRALKTTPTQESETQ